MKITSSQNCRSMENKLENQKIMGIISLSPDCRRRLLEKSVRPRNSFFFFPLLFFTFLPLYIPFCLGISFRNHIYMSPNISLCFRILSRDSIPISHKQKHLLWKNKYFYRPSWNSSRAAESINCIFYGHVW